MAGTATADASPASPAPAPSLPVPPPVPDQCNYKNLLQEFVQRTCQKLPVYHHKREGEQHQLKFECTVDVGSEQFLSVHSHSRLKEAEQDAARVAYDILVGREEDGDVTNVLGLIDQDVVLSKSILHEFAVKTKSTQPSYPVVNPERLGTVNMFVASVLFAGNTYTGETATNKKGAKQKAARAAIKSILATNDTCMSQIIRSKKEPITAITSSGHNKEKTVALINSEARICDALRGKRKKHKPRLLPTLPQVQQANVEGDQGDDDIPPPQPTQVPYFGMHPHVYFQPILEILGQLNEKFDQMNERFDQLNTNLAAMRSEQALTNSKPNKFISLDECLTYLEQHALSSDRRPPLSN